MHNIIFPAYPHLPKQANPFFEREIEAAKEAGFGISIVSDENTAGPMRITNMKADSYIYRGWIVRPDYYKEMCDLVGKPLLINYDDYMSSYELPQWYSKFSTEDTAESFVVEASEIVKDGVEKVAQKVADYFGSQAVIVKDYIKSLKHLWYDACYIKDASNIQESIRVVNNFFIERGRDFYGGLCFRKFLNLKKAGIHPKTKTPVPIEYRTFYLHKKPFTTISIWEKDGVDYGSELAGPPQDRLEEIGQKLISPFVAVDFAKDYDTDKWWTIEVNDGGAAGCPEHMDFKEFYRQLYQGIT